jgi:hypothetical protein
MSDPGINNPLHGVVGGKQRLLLLVESCMVRQLCLLNCGIQGTHIVLIIRLSHLGEYALEQPCILLLRD